MVRYRLECNEKVGAGYGDFKRRAERESDAPTTRQVLCPPKPKLLEMARRTRISRAVFGT